MAELRKVAVIGGSRIPFCRSSTDYHAIPNKKLMTRALRGLVSQYDLKGVPVGEVILGAVLKHARDFSLARETAIDAGLAWETPGLDIQRACGTSLEAAILIAHKIAAGQYDSGIAAGVDTSSEVPIELPVNLSSTLVKLSRGKSMMDRIKTLGDLNPSALGLSLPAVTEPRTGLSMGEHCEIMAKEWSIARADQDELAARSHNNAEQAYERGFFGDLVTPFKGVEKDNNVRPGTTPDKISKLGPAFDRTSGKGTLTAANSSPLTDGAAAVLLATEEWARSRDLPIQAWFTHSGLAGVDYENKEGLLMAPAYAVPQMLDRAGLTLQDFDFYEIHEAFAAQVLCTLKAWNDEAFCKEKLGRDKVLGEIDRDKLNVAGGSIALGHPFAATGARIVATLAKLLQEKGSGRGLISICTAGGMGVCAILEAAS